MNPVLIFRHIVCEGPAYLAGFLETAGIPYQIIRIDAGEKVPENINNIPALVFMGGPMSVNEPLPWIKQELKLIQKAHNAKMPILGHCLGGQLISKALGGEVKQNKVTEIGWFPVQPVQGNNIPMWLNDLPYDTEIFHWHGETFTLPEGAIPLFRNEFCENQGFILDNTMALQCHVEMQKEDIDEWLAYYKNDLPAPGVSIQSPEEIQYDIERRIKQLNIFADKIYRQWLTGF